MRLHYLILILWITSCDSLVNQMSFFPDTNHILSQDQLPPDISLEQIKTTDGFTIQGLYLHGKIRKEKVILYLHGNAGNMYHRIGEAKKLAALGSSLAPSIIGTFENHSGGGADVFILSYRGYAKSEGSPSEKGIYTDAHSAIDFLTQQLHYRPRDIIVFGRSLGTTAAVEVSQDREFHRIILITPLASGRDVAEAHWYGHLKFLAGNPFDSLSRINHLKSPVLIVHGDRDEVVPYSSGLKLFNEYRGPKKMVTIAGGGHNNLHRVDADLYWNSIEEFIYNK